jgi:hypothetical protein
MAIGPATDEDEDAIEAGAGPVFGAGAPTDRGGLAMANEPHPSAGDSSAADAEQRLTAQLRRLHRVEDSLRVRDQFLLEVQSELRSCERALAAHLQTVQATVGGLDLDSSEVVRAKATLLSFSLDRAIAAVDHVVELAGQTADRLSLVPEPVPAPRRPHVPETD